MFCWGITFTFNINVAQLLTWKSQTFFGTKELNGNNFQALLLNVAHLEDLGFVALPQFTTASHPNRVALLNDNKARTNFCLSSTTRLTPYINWFTFFEVKCFSGSTRSCTSSSVEAFSRINIHQSFASRLSNLFRSLPSSITSLCELILATIAQRFHRQSWLLAKDSLSRWVATSIGHGLQSPGDFMDHVLNFIGISRLAQLFGAVVDFFEQASSSFCDSILVWCISVYQDGLDAMVFKTIKKFTLKFKTLINDEETRTTKHSQPTTKESCPHQSWRPSCRMNHRKGAVEGANASDIQHWMFFFGNSTNNKQKLYANHHIEIIRSWGSCWQSCRLPLLLQTTFTNKLTEDILNDVVSCSSSFEKSHKLLHIGMAQVHMSSEDHRLLGCRNLVRFFIGKSFGHVSMMKQSDHHLIVHLQHNGTANASSLQLHPFAIPGIPRPCPPRQTMARTTNWYMFWKTSHKHRTVMKLPPLESVSMIQLSSPLFKISQTRKMWRSAMLGIDPLLNEAINHRFHKFWRIGLS